MTRVTMESDEGGIRDVLRPVHGTKGVEWCGSDAVKRMFTLPAGTTLTMGQEALFEFTAKAINAVLKERRDERVKATQQGIAAAVAGEVEPTLSERAQALRDLGQIVGKVGSMGLVDTPAVQRAIDEAGQPPEVRSAMRNIDRMTTGGDWRVTGIPTGPLPTPAPVEKKTLMLPSAEQIEEDRANEAARLARIERMFAQQTGRRPAGSAPAPEEDAPSTINKALYGEGEPAELSIFDKARRWLQI